MKKVLIVENSTGDLEQQKNLLARAELKLITAGSADEALTIHRRERVDLIIAGLELAGIAGDELCTQVRRDTGLKQVSFLLVGNKFTGAQERAEKCKANAFLEKPLRPAQFLDTVGKLLDVPVRKSYRVLLKVTAYGKFNNEPFFCNTQNISSSGVLIETEKTLGRGDRINCSFFLPGAEQIATDAEVMRVNKKTEKMTQYGIRFLDLKPAQRSAIDNFVRSRTHRS